MLETWLTSHGWRWHRPRRGTCCCRSLQPIWLVTASKYTAYTIDTCHSSKKPLFAADGDYCRDPQLAKVYRVGGSVVSKPSWYISSTTLQLSRGCHGRRSRLPVRASGPGCLCETVLPNMTATLGPWGLQCSHLPTTTAISMPTWMGGNFHKEPSPDKELQGVYGCWGRKKIREWVFPGAEPYDNMWSMLNRWI